MSAPPVSDGAKDRYSTIPLSVAGIITTVAGRCTQGYSGDGGLATSAELDTPIRVWVDPSRHVLVAEALNHRVRTFGVPMGLPVAR
jgi:hypothetical protein